MANDLGFWNPAYYANEFLILLQNTLGMAGRVHRGFDEERRTFDKGDTINIKRPSRLTVADAPGAMQDLTTEKVSLTIDKHREVRFGVTDKELAFAGDAIVKDHLMEAAYQVANDVDQKIADLTLDIPWAFNIAGSTMAVGDITSAWQTLFDLGAPTANEANMHFMVGGKEWNELMQLTAFAQWQGAGQQGVTTQQTAQLGRKYGFGFFANQNRVSFTPNTIADVAGTLTNAHSKGATSVTIAAVTASAVFKRGMSFNIASNSQRYTVTADATADGSGNLTMTITPPLVAAYSNGAVVDFGAVSNNGISYSGSETTKVKQNLAFHRDAFAIAFARLPDYGEIGQGLGMKIASVQDPVTGLAVRSKIYADGTNSKIGVVLDVLYGVKTLNPNLAVRIREA